MGSVVGIRSFVLGPAVGARPHEEGKPDGQGHDGKRQDDGPKVLSSRDDGFCSCRVHRFSKEKEGNQTPSTNSLVPLDVGATRNLPSPLHES
jgi:hypothetical protein